MSDATTHISAAEARRRMPPVAEIDDAHLRAETVEAIRSFPPHFWEAPATTVETYHNPHCRGESGLWTHVLMAATAYERLVESYLAQGLVSPHEADCGRSAVLLHDGRKFGGEWSPGATAADDHELVMGAWVQEKTDLPVEVANTIASHMGAWYDGPAPRTDLAQLVHAADMMSSDPNTTCGVLDPPAELSDVPTASF
ncbi:MAG: hypothetical protein ABEJ79_07690 [Halolamina sp.]